MWILLTLMSCGPMQVMDPEQPCLEVGYAISSRTFDCTGDAALANQRYLDFREQFACVPYDITDFDAVDTGAPVQDLFHCAFEIRQLSCDEVAARGDDLVTWLDVSTACPLVVTYADGSPIPPYAFHWPAEDEGVPCPDPALYGPEVTFTLVNNDVRSYDLFALDAYDFCSEVDVGSVGPHGEALERTAREGEVWVIRGIGGGELITWFEVAAGMPIAASGVIRCIDIYTVYGSSTEISERQVPMGQRSRSHRDLGVEEIVAHAREILRTEGAPALSMRRVAAACGVTPMALYHHVADKQALEDLVLDQILIELLEPRPEPVPDWRTAITGLYVRFRRALIDNPGAGLTFAGRPVVVRGTALLTEVVFGLLAEGAIRGDAAAETADALHMLVMGSLVNDLTRPPRVRDQLISKLDPEQAPLLARLLPAYSHRDPEQRFLLALGWLLDGALLDRGHR